MSQISWVSRIVFAIVQMVKEFNKTLKYSKLSKIIKKCNFSFYTLCFNKILYWALGSLLNVENLGSWKMHFRFWFQSESFFIWNLSSSISSIFLMTFISAHLLIFWHWFWYFPSGIECQIQNQTTKLWFRNATRFHDKIFCKEYFLLAWSPEECKGRSQRWGPKIMAKHNFNFNWIPQFILRRQGRLYKEIEV